MILDPNRWKKHRAFTYGVHHEIVKIWIFFVEYCVILYGLTFIVCWFIFRKINPVVNFQKQIYIYKNQWKWAVIITKMLLLNNEMVYFEIFTRVSDFWCNSYKRFFIMHHFGLARHINSKNDQKFWTEYHWEFQA